MGDRKTCSTSNQSLSAHARLGSARSGIALLQSNRFIYRSGAQLKDIHTHRDRTDDDDDDDEAHFLFCAAMLTLIEEVDIIGQYWIIRFDVAHLFIP